MRRIPRLAAMLLLALLAVAPSFPATLYALIYANTEDEGIGCIFDVVNMGNFLQDIQKETGLVLKARVRLTVSGVAPDKMALVKRWAEVVDGWSRKELDKDLKALNPGKDDVVFFYYSGHGGRMSNKKGRWPDMALPDTLTDLSYPASEISKKAVKPRFVIAMGDCCNSYMDKSVSSKTKSAKSTTGLKALFLEPKGVIVASSSEPGQYSLGGSDGGVFTNAYIKAAYNPSNDSWDRLLKMAQTTTAKDSGGKQKAQFELQGLPAAAGGTAVAAAPAAPAASGWGQPAPAAPAASGWGQPAAPAPAASGWGQPAAPAPAASGWGQPAAPAASAPAASGWGSAASAAPAGGEEEEAEETGSGGEEELGEASSAVAYIPFENGKASGTRTPGSSPYPFVELVSASLKDEDGDLVLRMKPKSIPKKLVFNDKDVPGDSLEYEWAAYIDVDGDQSEDFSLGIEHFKAAKDKRAEAGILEGCYAALYKMGEDGAEILEAEVEASLEKDNIVVRLSGYGEYFEFEEGSSVYFSAVYYKGGESCIPD